MFNILIFHIPIFDNLKILFFSWGINLFKIDEYKLQVSTSLFSNKSHYKTVDCFEVIIENIFNHSSDAGIAIDEDFIGYNQMCRCPW